MTFIYQEILSQLAAPFPADEVGVFPVKLSNDKKKALPAFYVDNRAVQRRLDETCVWELEEPKPGPDGGLIQGIRVLVLIADEYRWLTRWDGATNTKMGNQDDSDFEVKGGLSNAMRRAAVQWGVGRYLYAASKHPTVARYQELNQYKQFVKPPQMPKEFLPNGAKGAATITMGDIADERDEAPAKPEKPASTLKPKELADFQKAANGKARTAVAKIYNEIIDGKTSFADGLAKVSAMKAASEAKK